MPHETNGTTPKLSREADSLSPWVPSPEEPWDREAACHLLRRCGFGATKERVDRALEEGVEATVESLLSPSGDARSRTAEALLARGERLVRRRNTPLMGSWWLQWMSQTSDPLRERLTLAWHDLFAVSDAKVNSARLMFDQNKALRTHALGNLRTLAREGITRSAAMLRFLDADSNRKGQPNENLARELFELFLLGIGNYTEIDIREGARALTGLRAPPRGSAVSEALARRRAENHLREAWIVRPRWLGRSLLRSTGVRASLRANPLAHVREPGTLICCDRERRCKFARARLRVDAGTEATLSIAALLCTPTPAEHHQEPSAVGGGSAARLGNDSRCRSAHGHVYFPGTATLRTPWSAGLARGSRLDDIWTLDRASAFRRSTGP